MGRYNRPMIVLDVESSGTEYHVHSILSIGALELEKPANRFYGECRIWDGAHIMDEALAVNGFTREEINEASKQTEAQLVRSFLAWCNGAGEKTLAGQNVSFDRDFVKAAAVRAHIDYDLAYRTIDTHTLAWMHMVKRGLTPPIDPVKQHSKLNLDTVLNYVGIPSEPEPHNALTGAMSHAEVISRLLYDTPLLPEFSQYALPW